MLVVMSVLRVTLCAQVGFLLVELGERVVVALALSAACDIGCSRSRARWQHRVGGIHRR